ncbi:hypothetical protein MMC26_006864 [Xylographa opegraphella]|nr:hypothetical protein [Xylographa opegraphella]
MGHGGYLYLVNGTTYDWHLSNQTSEFMERWTFPSMILSGSVEEVYIEWGQFHGHDPTRDKGDLSYTFAASEHNFQLEARATRGFQLLVRLGGISTWNDHQGAIIDLSWVDGGTHYPRFNGVCFVLSGTGPNFVSTSNRPLSVSWMQASLGMIGQRPLRHVCMPGSHDSGISVINGGTLFGDARVCQTQVKSIADQLAFGIRFFDIRPVIASSRYYTGHYGNLPGLGWQGVNGQSISQIVQQINVFTAVNKELVILSISHDFNTDEGRDYRAFTQDEWDGLFQELAELEHLFTHPRSTNDLTLLTMNQLIGNKQAAVIVVVSLDRSHLTLGNFAGRGFYYISQFPFYDNYANSNDPNVMMEDQLQKLRRQRDDPDKPLFSLDWTLTHRTLQDVTVGPSILEMASFMDPRLVTYVIPSCSSEIFPNILNIDKVENTNSIAVATAINTLFAS